MIEAKCSLSGSLPQSPPQSPPPSPTVQDNSFAPATDQTEPEVEKGSGQKKGKSWTAFFERWAELNLKKMNRETLADRERQEAREKVHANQEPPGKKGAVVYEWEEVDGFWVRKYVDRSDVRDVWYSFSKAQRRYDSFYNEWDLHPEFCPGRKWYHPPSSDEEDDELPVAISTVQSSSAGTPSNPTRNHGLPELCPSSIATACTTKPFPETFDTHQSDPLSSSTASAQDMVLLTSSGPLCKHPFSAGISDHLPIPSDSYAQPVCSDASMAPSSLTTTSALYLRGPPNPVDTENTNMTFANCTSRRPHPPGLDEPPAKCACRFFTTSPSSHPTPIPIQSPNPDPVLLVSVSGAEYIHQPSSTTSSRESFLTASDESRLWTDDLLDIHRDQSPEVTEAAVEDLKTVLYCRYGYSMEEHPYMRISLKLPKELTWLEVCRRLSIPEVMNLSPDVIIPIKDFVVALLRSEHAGELVPGKFWDLSASNSRFLGFRNAFVDIDKRLFGNQILYVFRPRGLHPSRDTAWELALPDAASALECVRRQLGPHTVSLAEHLVERGIPFLTLSRTIVNPVLTSHGTPHNDISLGYRPIGYTPHLADYAVYRASLASFLRRPHARAALLKGGIIWRLAREFLDNEAVLMGPSEHALHGILGTFTCDGAKFCDDQLTEGEMDLISGVYKVYTGVANS